MDSYIRGRGFRIIRSFAKYTEKWPILAPEALHMLEKFLEKLPNSRKIQHISMLLKGVSQLVLESRTSHVVFHPKSGLCFRP